MTDLDITAIIVSFISLISSIAVAIITYHLISKNDTKLENLRSDLEEKRSEENALRAYKYKARKRLYEECEPILFQIYELSEAARGRILHIPLRASQGHLPYPSGLDNYKEDCKSPSEEEYKTKSEVELKNYYGWLSFPNYYFVSTIYILLAPLAAFRLLKSRLTVVDLELDPRIKNMYLLSKYLYRTFSAANDLAIINPEIKYGEYGEHGQEIYAGHLDNMTEALIEYYNQPELTPRLMSFGKFDKRYASKKQKNEINLPFDIFYDIFRCFHPKSKPVLWRILITQLYIYDAILRCYNSRLDVTKTKDLKLIKIPEVQRKDLDWRKDHREAEDHEVYVDPLNAAKVYLHNIEELKHLIK